MTETVPVWKTWDELYRVAKAHGLEEYAISAVQHGKIKVEQKEGVTDGSNNQKN